jgi:signal transduction histidine kinase
MLSNGTVETRQSPALGASEMAEVTLASNYALAHQSVAGIFSHWALVVVLLATTSVAAKHPLGAAMTGAWMALIGVGRLLVAKSFTRLYPRSPARWVRLFGLGLVLSSLTWGLGGAALMMAVGVHQDSRLVLVCLAGVSAAGLMSLCADRALLRLHMACMLLPVLVVGFFLPGGARHMVGFVLIVAAYGGFLWVQGGYAHASFFQALVTTKLLERQAVELEAARVESVEASRVKSEFLANMSHEIRTPMTAVIGYADLLLDPSLGASERVNHLQTIRRNGEHLMTVINDILDVS